MAYVAKRRRGPNKPKPEIQTPETQEATASEPVAKAKRRRRASVGGLHLKLAVPAREGFHRRWVNDTPGRIASFQELAYDPVSDPAIKSDTPGGPVTRLVGTQVNGHPLHAVLMECPLDEYQAGIDEKEEQHRVIDEAILAGKDATGRVRDAYGEGSIEMR